MEVIVRVPQADLQEMDVDAQQLQEAVRSELSSMDVDGDTLYIADPQVSVEVTD